MVDEVIRLTTQFELDSLGYREGLTDRKVRQQIVGTVKLVPFLIAEGSVSRCGKRRSVIPILHCLLGGVAVPTTFGYNVKLFDCA